MAVRVAEAGVTDVHVSIHGADASVHDYHTAAPGSWQQSLLGVGAARAAGLPVVATTVLTRSNYRSLSAMPRLLAARGVAAWQVAVPFARGRAADHFDRVVPRLGLAVPFALHALGASAQIGLPAWLSGVPLCMTGPFAARVLPPDLSAARSFSTTCDPCAIKDRCPGLDRAYLERFAGDELSARDSAPHAVLDRYARMFVGLGDMAKPSERAMPEAPRDARRRLPVLARPQPGASEARRAEPKTGEALREILPSLFDTKNEP